MTRKTLGLLLALGLFGAPPCDAEKLYRYRDPAGTLSFSDRPPAGSVPYAVEQVRVSQPPPRVTVENRGSRTQPLLYAVNEYRGPVELELAFESSENLASDPPLPLRVVLPAGGETRLAAFRPLRSDRSWSYRYRYRYVVGDPGARHAPPGPYRLPFSADASFRVSQGFRGDFSHTQPHSEYAVDIAMPEGTPVLAARGGVVMEMANDYFSGGIDQPAFAERANYIRILHDDGTMGVYAHLQLESAQVGVGSRVSAGQLLAHSGNTGFSSGPHLHFVIERNRGLEIISVPFAFAGPDGEELEPRQGQVLGAR
ncbi:hypothetical protein DESUT3_12730 [Desulfuromonas versatilis]|uniref:Peptidase M23B n=1 Tax=Desulfuromonas versatilis TaxID=2802975 RepID=A0ABM8HQR2_9BACT|nr:peptidoglycan DD-metalloendopeptidase family protein [Desulfuromonas versatilis]BCR04204.1 hypothetical protein DESUT3_12730 [Desulfuromonas versatilis]